MLHHCQAKSLDDIYLEDIPHIIHPATAVHDLEDTALPNRIIQEWNLPQGYTQFVSRYHQFHHQRPWLAYRDTLDDIRYGKIVLLRKDITGNAGPGVISNGNLRNDLPLSLFTRLRDIISRQLKRPGITFDQRHQHSTPNQQKPLIPKRLVVFSQLAGFIMEMWRDFDIRLNNLAAKLLKAMTRY